MKRRKKRKNRKKCKIYPKREKKNEKNERTLDVVRNNDMKTVLTTKMKQKTG